MLIKKVQHLQTSTYYYAIQQNDGWKILDGNHQNILDVFELLKTKTFSTQPFEKEAYQDVIPFIPRAYRDFMLFEKHAIDAARGFAKKYLSTVFPVIHWYEKFTGKVFPALKPSKRYYQYPIYYLGNHLNFFTHNDKIKKPTYTKELDYELEIAAIITKPLKNAKPEDVNEAIGGFVILNDFSARDQQMSEMKSGFGPMKTKNFANAISATVVTAEALLPQINQLNVSVFINDKLIISANTSGIKYSIQEAIAYASWEEQLHPGELFGTGTIPGCTGIENGKMLHPNDKITLVINGIGELSNYII